MVAFGCVMLFAPGVGTSPHYGVLGDAPAVWGALTLTLGVLQLVMLHGRWQRRLFAVSAVATFVWLWIALAFLLAVGHLSTAQAMYVPASAASAWLAVRTAPITW